MSEHIAKRDQLSQKRGLERAGSNQGCEWRWSVPGRLEVAVEDGPRHADAADAVSVRAAVAELGRASEGAMDDIDRAPRATWRFCCLEAAGTGSTSNFWTDFSRGNTEDQRAVGAFTEDELLTALQLHKPDEKNAYKARHVTVST